jgi:hypothetical protein
MKRILSLLFCLTAMQACTIREGTVIEAEYDCADGQEMQVSFEGEYATVRRGSVSVLLDARPVASGYRYADSTYELRGKGRVAQWVAGANPPIGCTERSIRK